MNQLLKRLSLGLLLVAISTTAQAKYTEVMDPNGLTKDMGRDYGLVDDNASSNQSDVFQQAIDDLASQGGGRLIVPKGTYQLAGVRFKSNIHMLIEAGTVLKPYWPKGTKTVVFTMDAEQPANKKKATLAEKQAYIENVSIRGIGGRYTIDYSDRGHQKGEAIRGIVTKMVKNFLIADLDVKDSYTVFCGITLTPYQTRDSQEGWPITRSTDGTIRNCRIFNASPGYGLTQLHGAQDVHFEDIYAEGGVTLRLETGAVGDKTAVYNITAKRVANENGRCAVMFGPHSAMNGLVQVEQVYSKGSTYAVSISKAGVKDAELKHNPDATDGVFADGSYVKGIHAVFGKKAQVKGHAILSIPEEYYGDLNLRWFNKFFEGPSIGAVKDTSAGHFTIKVEDVTMEGFKYNADKPILTEADVRPGNKFKEIEKWKKAYGHSN